MISIFRIFLAFLLCLILRQSNGKNIAINKRNLLDSFKIFCKDKPKRNFCSDHNTKFVVKFLPADILIASETRQIKDMMKKKVNENHAEMNLEENRKLKIQAENLSNKMAKVQAVGNMAGMTATIKKPAPENPQST